MDNLIIQTRNRPPDVTTKKIPLRTRYLDRNFVNLQNGIQDRSAEIPRGGIISSPTLSVTGLPASGMTVWYSAFECLTPEGIKCEISAGMVRLDTAGLVPRIDVLAVDPLIQYDEDGEIEYSGEIQAVKGSEIGSYPRIPHLPSTWLKIGEAGICAGHCICSLRSYIPDKVPLPMAAPRVGLTDAMKLFVNPFQGYISSNSRVNYPGGFSPAFTPPGISGMHRLDLLVLTPSSNLEIISGNEVVSPSRPEAPNYPALKMPIAEVYLQDIDSYMHQDMVNDIRPHFTYPVIVPFAEIEWIPANDFNSKTSEGPSDIEIAGLFPVLYFDDSIEESIYSTLRIPHRWNGETGLTPIISWVNVNGLTPSYSVKWGIEYAAVDLCQGITPSILGSTIGSCVSAMGCAGLTTGWTRKDAPIGLCVSGLTPGGILGFRIFRDATDPEDTLLGDAAFIGVGFEWEGFTRVDRSIIYR